MVSKSPFHWLFSFLGKTIAFSQNFLPLRTFAFVAHRAESLFFQRLSVKHRDAFCGLLGTNTCSSSLSHNYLGQVNHLRNESGSHRAKDDAQSSLTTRTGVSGGGMHQLTRHYWGQSSVRTNDTPGNSVADVKILLTFPRVCIRTYT